MPGGQRARGRRSRATSSLPASSQIRLGDATHSPRPSPTLPHDHPHPCTSLSPPPNGFVTAARRSHGHRPLHSLPMSPRAPRCRLLHPRRDKQPEKNHNAIPNVSFDLGTRRSSPSIHLVQASPEITLDAIETVVSSPPSPLLPRARFRDVALLPVATASASPPAMLPSWPGPP